jgi:hypothetical protein
MTATRRLDGEVVKLLLEKPRRGAFYPSIFATSHSFDERDTSIDNVVHRPPFSRARPVAAQVTPQVVDLTMDSDDVS